MSVGVKWAAFVDLARPLEPDEQERLTEALELVGGGSVGPTRGKWEAFFAVHARSAADAEASAHRAIEHALRRAGVEVSFSIGVQRLQG